MKNFYFKSLAVLMALTLLNAQTFAVGMPFTNKNTSDECSTVITFDENEVYNEFSAVEELASLIASSQLTVDEISSIDASLLNNVSTTTSYLAMADEESSGPPLGIPSFIWGCVPAACLSPLFGIGGILLVYFMSDKNKSETKKAVWGCVVGSIISGVLILNYYNY